MPVYCPECGGEMHYDPSRKQYVCTSCGLTLTRSEYMLLKQSQSKAVKNENEEDKWRREYLKWWLSSKSNK
ncbi:MAG: hypothetical protein J7J99_01630 [Thermoprotei archaeon]|nr:hypothetical protein [Thermoprotei archaeon]